MHAEAEKPDSDMQNSIEVNVVVQNSGLDGTNEEVCNNVLTNSEAENICLLNKLVVLYLKRIRVSLLSKTMGKIIVWPWFKVNFR